MRHLIAFGMAFGLAIALTPLLITVTRRFGLVSHPQEERWHRRPTSLFGGVAIFVSFLLPVLTLIRFHDRQSLISFSGLLIGASLMFLLGLVDDFVHLKPSSKLIGQVIAACILVYSGVYFQIVDIPLLTIPLTIIWVVGITNAFNLLDNMDGLAAGVATICALTIFTLNSMLGVGETVGLVSLVFCGALMGFLVFNFNPARIFMGDCGSMMIGFTLAGLSIAGTWQQASNVFLIMAVPVLILAVPIFDTAFVAVTRRLRGQPVSVGGKDHTSHRLVALGLSERRAVVLLYTVCGMFGGIAALGLRYDAFVIGTLVILAAIVILIFGMYLAQDRLYQRVKETPGDERPARGFVYNTFVMHKRRVIEVLIDLFLFGAAFGAAFLIRFEGNLNPFNERLLLMALPVIIPIKLMTFWAFGLYKRLWDFVGVQDLVSIAKAVLTSSLISVLAMWGLTRLEGYSRAMFLLDGILLLLFTAGSRVLFRVFQETLRNDSHRTRRLLVVGAGTAGELVLREIRRDQALDYRAVAFVDDDPEKWGRQIHGIQILGGREVIETLGTRDAFDEILIAIPSLDEEERQSLLTLCRSTGKTTRVMQKVSTTFIQ